jgi:two-component system chemotaxis response regulator CheY
MISWFSRRDERKEGRRSSRTSHQPGVAVGPAIFRPKRVHDIREDLRRAVGQVVDLVFVTVAGPDERWAGQNIYMERPGPRSVLRGAWVADEDVQFIDAPRTADAHDSARREARPGRLAHDAPLVLVADGSRDTRDLYGLVLTTAGFQVIEAEDGLSAIALARAAAPDAIVIDLDLPQMSGLDAIKLLRAEAGTSRTPILAFTAHGEAAAAEAIRYGADAHRRKPCFPEAFLEALRSILPAAVELKGVRR